MHTARHNVTRRRTHLESSGVVHLRHEEGIRDCDGVTEAVLARSLLQARLDALEAVVNPVLAPGQLVLRLLITLEEAHHPLQHAQVLHGLDVGADVCSDVVSD